MEMCLQDPGLHWSNPFTGPSFHSLYLPFLIARIQLAILENSITLARFASISQQHGLVPIVEPEVLMDGDFPAEITSIVTERVLSSVVKALLDHHVFLEGTILKPNMIRSGSDSVVQIGAKEIGALTLRTLQRTVPVALPGIAFLSGGLSEEQASLALSEINKSPGNKPWCSAHHSLHPPSLSLGNCPSPLGELFSNPVCMLGWAEMRTLLLPKLHSWREHGLTAWPRSANTKEGLGALSPSNPTLCATTSTEHRIFPEP
jgi:hypothetical protein